MTRSMSLTFRLLSLTLACLAGSGCVESSRENATGKASMRGVNAIVDAPDVVFKIEQRSLGTLIFGASSPVRRFDDLSYTFNFDASVPGEDDQRRLASRFVDITRDTAYLFVIDGSVGNAEIVLWEQPERQWEQSESVFELNFGHLNDAAGRVDVYFAAEGVAPAAGSAVATLERGARLGPSEFAAGDYVVTVTPADEPQTILYRSATRSFIAATTSTILLLDGDPSRTGDLTVRQITAGGDSLELPDPRFPPRGRIVHAAAGVGNVDVAENGDFGALVAADVALGEVTADLPLTAGINTYTFTAAGNQGAIVVESEQVIGDGLYENLVLTGSAAEPGVLNTVSARRPYATSGRIGFLHAAAAFESVDVYLQPAGSSIDDSNPTSPFIPFGASTGLVPFVAGDYEIVVAVAGEKTVLAGPQPLGIANRDVVEVFVIESADPNSVAILVVRNTP